MEVGDDLVAGLRHLGGQCQLLVVGAPDPDTASPDGDLLAFLDRQPCAAMVVPAP